MVKKDSKFHKFLKSIGLISGSGGVMGVILALSGICLPCVLAPLGFVGAGLLFIFSFFTDYKWWFLGISLVLLILALSAKRVTVCKDGVCQVDIKQGKKIKFSISNLKTNLLKLNNWKTYIIIPIVLLFLALLYTLSLSSTKSGELDLSNASLTNPYEDLIGGAPVKGPGDGKVTIIEYSDYFCPACLPLYKDVIEPTLAKYEGKVNFASVQVNIFFNLGYSSVHAAYCADEQGKYWQMHESLLDRMEPFVGKEKNSELGRDMLALSKAGTPEYFTEIAGDIDGVDTNKYLKCMESDKYSDKIAKTTAIFQKLGLNGVPVIIINGKYFTGNPTQENLSEVIEYYLKD